MSSGLFSHYTFFVSSKFSKVHACSVRRMEDTVMSTPSEFNSVDWKPLTALSRRIGQRYGFAAVGLTRSDVALLGGAVHFEFSHSQSAKGDIERGNPIPFSQVHCVSSVLGSAAFECTLLSIKPATDIPCPRLYHSATSVRSDAHSVVVFGGQAFTDKRKLADIWCLDIAQDASVIGEDSGRSFSGVWKELAPASRSTAFPPPRSKHAVSASGNVLIVSGGCGFEDTVLGDMWTAHIEHDGGKKSVLWKRVNSPIGRVPSPRKLHALSPMVSELELVMHGGIDANGAQLSDLWIGQFVNDEKSRCVWTELVRAPHPRSGHVVFPAFSVDEAKGDRQLLVFGGNQPTASRYNIDTGAWQTCAFPQGAGHTFTATQVDVVYTSSPEETQSYEIPSVLMIPDTVLRSNPSSPFLGSIFMIDLDSGEAAVQPPASPSVPLVTVNLAANAAQRRHDYRTLSRQLPPIPAVDAGNNGEHALMPVQATHQRAADISAAIPQSPFFLIDYLLSGLFAGGNVSVSASSWSGGNPNACHVLVTSEGVVPSFSSLESFKAFINTPATADAVAGVANACIVVCNAPSGDKYIAFISEAVNRHSQASQFVSPVISISTTNYAEVQATLRLMMTYTPFRSAAAIQELFALFTRKDAGFLLVDFDGESENKGPVLAHHKPTLMKDAAVFWFEALHALQRPRPRIEAFALTFLQDTDVAINGQIPSASLLAVMKSKLLQSPTETSIGKFGSVLIGKMKNAPNVGVLVYAHGQLVRHVKGRFAFEDTDAVDELEDALNNVTGIVDVGDALTPVNGALSDFQEAVEKSAEWTAFVSKIEEACFAYASKHN